MAHIRRLEGGRWQARYRDAERKERAHNFCTKAEAQRWLDEQTADLVRGDWRDPRSGRVTIGELSETWYATTAALKTSTRLSYRSLLDAWVLPRWSSIQVRKVEHGAVAAWVAEVGAKRAHRRHGRLPECCGPYSSWPSGIAGSPRTQRPA